MTNEVTPILKIFETVGTSVKNWYTILSEFLQLLGHTLYWIIFGAAKKKPISAATITTIVG